MDTLENQMVLPMGVDNEERPFPNQCRYETLQQVHRAMHAVGFEGCELIVGVNFAKSNTWTGKMSFEGKCLHDVSGEQNPYTAALKFIAKRMISYDDDHLVPCYGFGDATTGKKAVFSFFQGNKPAKGLDAIVERYKSIAPVMDVSGPTSFAPLIRQAMRDVYNNRMRFHVLLILADGQVSADCMEETKRAIVDACDFPLSIVVIGVGDGPWTDMYHFDNELPERSWDNFHFFEFSSVVDGSAFFSQQRQEEEFEFNVIAEIPEQYVHARLLTGRAKQAGVSCRIRAIPADNLIDPPCEVV